MPSCLRVASCLRDSGVLEPVRFTLSFPAPLSHYVEVEAIYPTDGQSQITLMMPVWTPGSYLVREFSRNVEALTAADPNHAPLAVEKTRKNRWHVPTNGARSVAVHYRVYAHEMSVRTNWIDDRFALLNGAPTFITLLTTLNRPHEVRLVLPQGWSRSVSGMPAAPGKRCSRSETNDTTAMGTSTAIALRTTTHWSIRRSLWGILRSTNSVWLANSTIS